ncbi:NAD+ synthase [bacterium]|nr:NAD+ synthase [bacterium]
MKITLAQLNPTIGDFEGNLSKIENTLKQVQHDHPDIVIFSELFLTGYPPLDLLERKDFINNARKALDKLLKLSSVFTRMAILCGTIQPTDQKRGKHLHNSALLIQDGKILFRQHKTLLPTYDVFDEARYFEPSHNIEVFQFKEETLGITICEDAWNDPSLRLSKIYNTNPVAILSKKGATLLINISASPFNMGKEETRHALFQKHATQCQKVFIFLNQTGGNDELIFDGRSMIFNKKGQLIWLAPSFKEHVETIDLSNPPPTQTFFQQNKIEAVYEALILGIRDYMSKCHFQKAVLGLSGGIDSALTCCLASAAIGPDNVIAVAMPSPYTSKSSVEDAEQLAVNLGVQFKNIPITSIYQNYLDHLNDHFHNKSPDITEENIQARIRGNILMALSNKFGCLTLSTGNKSEISVGYCTLYGDMSGGLSVLGDVFKTLVYQIAEYINRDNEIIPRRIIEKPPSAELKPNQTDQDTLPPYDILDKILYLYLDKGNSKEEIVSEGLNRDTVDWVIRAIERNEYKRRQAAPGLKITTKAFGIGRRIPVAAKYTDP